MTAARRPAREERATITSSNAIALQTGVDGPLENGNAAQREQLLRLRRAKACAAAARGDDR